MKDYKKKLIEQLTDDNYLGIEMILLAIAFLMLSLVILGVIGLFLP